MFLFGQESEAKLRIKGIILENFRGYKARTHVTLEQFTALIGRNDAGKSTILEALDYFFENSKPDHGDASIEGDAKQVLIGVVFDRLPSELTLDRGARSTLETEHLLNQDGDLEIHKIFNLAVQRPGAAKVFARAVHPTEEKVQGLLQKNNTALKALVKEMGLQDDCNLNENPSMRQAVYKSVGGNLLLELQNVPLNDDNGKAVWGAIQARLPLYALFRSDRASSDQDPEVQNPMKAAVHKALADIQDDLAEVVEKVRVRAEDTAKRTLEQLQAAYPDLANSLTPQFRSPSWANMFKVDLESDDGVPLNKRGSGVRRLILMSFFQAEAEKKRKEAGEGAFDGEVPVIYAIEEPETSQHPDNQRRIVTALMEVAEAGDQVLVTTHMPALAELMPVDCLRYIDRGDDGNVRIRSGDPEVYAEVAEALGVLPDPILGQTVKVAVLVEGKTDIDALVSLSLVLSESGELPPLDHDKIFWALGGGETLKDWVERDYLSNLDLPQVVIFDSDRTAEALPAHEDKQRRLNEINAWKDRTAFMTSKREVENFVHPDTIARLSDGLIELPNGFDPDFGDLPTVFAAAMRDAIDNKGLTFKPVDLNGERLRASKRYTKHILTSYVMRNMTVDEIKERSKYERDGATHYEVYDYLKAIQTYT